MAKRRMFSQEVLESDRFIDMSSDAQILYVHMCMTADDDGFVGGKKKVMRMLGADENAFAELKDHGFVIEFQSGVIAITHWKLHNRIKKDRYDPTVYTDEFNMLDYGRSEGYRLRDEKREEKEKEKEKETEKEREKANGPAAVSSSSYPCKNDVEAIPLPDDADAPPEEKNARDIHCSLPGEAGPENEKRTAGSKPAAPVYVDILGGGRHTLTNAEYDKLAAGFPGTDVAAEINNYNRWLSAHPGNTRDELSVMWYLEDWLRKNLELELKEI